MLNREENKAARIWGMLCHLTALFGILGIPFGHVIGPLLVWFFKKNAFPFVNDQGKESLNFQLSMTLVALIAAILILIKIGTILLILLATINVVLVIIASVRAYAGETFRYPFKIQFFK